MQEEISSCTFLEGFLQIMNCRKLFTKILVACVLFLSPTANAKFESPVPTTEFEKMSFPPVYPTYSWRPIANTEFYQVQVVQVTSSGEKIVRDLKNTEGFDRVTDFQPFTEKGKYFWRVRVVNQENIPLSDWSEKKFFEVTAPVKFAVLGDSISHGGASFIPSGQISCQWETFCDVPVKNIARSGDTTAMMIERFERDVLPFQPKILIIFGGINDIREGASAKKVIQNLKTLQKKCAANKITPVFCTLTPMNEKILRGKGITLTKSDWRGERKKINSWILKNKFSVDISKNLYDADSELRADFTPDGLHPDLRGKKFIGEEIEKFLLENFAEE